MENDFKAQKEEGRGRIILRSICLLEDTTVVLSIVRGQKLRVMGSLLMTRHCSWRG